MMAVKTFLVKNEKRLRVRGALRIGISGVKEAVRQFDYYSRITVSWRCFGVRQHALAITHKCNHACAHDHDKTFDPDTDTEGKQGQRDHQSLTKDRHNEV